MIAVLLELGPLIEVAAVLDGEGMEIEALAQELELRRGGGQKIDPAQDA
jgi:hypothetical protein